MTKKSRLALDEAKYVQRFLHKCGKIGKSGEMFIGKLSIAFPT